MRAMVLYPFSLMHELSVRLHTAKRHKQKNNAFLFIVNGLSIDDDSLFAGSVSGLNLNEVNGSRQGIKVQGY